MFTTFWRRLARRRRWELRMLRLKKGCASLESVSGRFQRIDAGQPFFVIVDYAHTDDALENLIRTARELNAKGRIITLFGCGGNKDRTKRPVMGEVTGRAQRSDDSCERQSAQRGSAENYQRHYCWVAENVREIFHRAGPRKSHWPGAGRGARRRHRAARRQGSRELSDFGQRDDCILMIARWRGRRCGRVGIKMHEPLRRGWIGNALSVAVLGERGKPCAGAARARVVKEEPSIR